MKNKEIINRILGKQMDEVCKGYDISESELKAECIIDVEELIENSCEKALEEKDKQFEKLIDEICNKWQKGILKDEKCKEDYELNDKPRMVYNAMGIVCEEIKQKLRGTKHCYKK